MKHKGLFIAVLAALVGHSPVAGARAMPEPPGFDIWLVDVDATGEGARLQNITSRPGYDNQPAFVTDSEILYTGVGEGGQTDLLRLDMDSGELQSLLVTPESEYSPTPSPRDSVTTVRVSLEGVQQLWELEPGENRYKPLLPGIEGVGYHLWLDGSTVALFIVTQPSELHVANLESGEVMVLAKDIGRSMQRPPGTRNVLAFIEPGQDDKRWIKTLDLDSRRITPLAPVIGESQDFAFLPDGRLLMADGKAIYQREAESWKMFAEFPQLPGPISRLAVSPSGQRLAMVVEE